MMANGSAWSYESSGDLDMSGDMAADGDMGADMDGDLAAGMSAAMTSGMDMSSGMSMGMNGSGAGWSVSQASGPQVVTKWSKPVVTEKRMFRPYVV